MSTARTILVLDGVTGAGKSSVLAALRTRLGDELAVIDEDETLGTVMDDIRDPAWCAAPRFPALTAALAHAEALAPRPVILERFHITTYALFPAWDHVSTFDARLARLGASLVLLTVPEAALDERAIARPERAGWDAGMAEYYGTRDAAVDAARESQRRRIEALARTALPYLHLDTGERAWGRYADEILAFWR